MWFSCLKRTNLILRFPSCVEFLGFEIFSLVSCIVQTMHRAMLLLPTRLFFSPIFKRTLTTQQMSPPLPPYDVLLFVGLWVILFAGGVACCACCRFRCFKVCCGESVNNQDSTAPNSGGAVLMMPTGGAASTSTAGPPPSGTRPSDDGDVVVPTRKRLIVAAVWGLVSVVLSFILTIILLAILASAGFLDLLVFSPQLASTCVSGCPFETRGGLSGWVDDMCCSYNVSDKATFGSLEPLDVYLSLTDESGLEPLGLVVHGWLLVNSTPASAATSSSNGYISMIYNHGSGGNVASGYRIARYQFLLEQGNIAVLVFDYPGYGKSTGATNIDNTLKSAIGASVWFSTYLGNGPKGLPFGWNSSQIPRGSATTPLRVPVLTGGVRNDLRNLTILGRSMGGGVAGYLERETDYSSHSLLLQSTWSDLRAIANYYFPMFGWVFSSFTEANPYAKMSSVKNLAPASNGGANSSGYQACLYHAHSKTDAWIPFEQAQDLDSKISNKRANCSQFVIVQDALHTQPLTQVERTSLRSWLETQRN